MDYTKGTEEQKNTPRKEEYVMVRDDKSYYEFCRAYKCICDK